MKGAATTFQPSLPFTPRFPSFAASAYGVGFRRLPKPPQSAVDTRSKRRALPLLPRVWVRGARWGRRKSTEFLGTTEGGEERACHSSPLASVTGCVWHFFEDLLVSAAVVVVGLRPPHVHSGPSVSRGLRGTTGHP